MGFTGFPEAVFDVFDIPDFSDRMTALRTLVRPPLSELGTTLAPTLSAIVGHPVYPHVAAHMRRRVNPPDDTWVAWSRSARGYKAYAHFEAGVSLKGVFVRFVIKPEGQGEKFPLLEVLTPSRLSQLNDPPGLFWYRDDHGGGPVPLGSIDRSLWTELKTRAAKPNQSLTIGMEIPRSHPMVGQPQLAPRIVQALEALIPLYRWAVPKTVAAP